MLGATGATGHFVVEKLLQQGREVRVIVRSPHKLAHVSQNPNLKVTQAPLLNLSDEELMEQVNGCSAIVSCLGHSVICGEPKYLCRDAAKRCVGAIEKIKPSTPIKYILMNSNGVANIDGSDAPHRSMAMNFATGCLYYLLPPHRDNVEAAGYLAKKVGTDNAFVEWSIVRPDDLIDSEEVTAYETHPAITGGIFGVGQTSRINTADFMSRLVYEDELWEQWKGKWPYVANVRASKDPQGSAPAAVKEI